MAKLIQAEIEYFKENDIGIHSDIEPHGCKFEDINHKIDHYGNSK